MNYGEIVREFFSRIVLLFKGVVVPGFHFSFFEFFVGLGVVSLSVALARLLLRIGGKSDDD